MSKAVLVMDMPETCCDCNFCREIQEGIEACCEIMDEIYDNNLCRMIDSKNGYCQEKPNWCPLKELPDEIHNDEYMDEYCDGYDDGHILTEQQIILAIILLKLLHLITNRSELINFQQKMC